MSDASVGSYQCLLTLLPFSKAHIEQDTAQAKLEVPPTSKYWEPYRAYEKRIVNASTKDKGSCYANYPNDTVPLTSDLVQLGNLSLQRNQSQAKETRTNMSRQMKTTKARLRDSSSLTLTANRVNPKRDPSPNPSLNRYKHQDDDHVPHIRRNRRHSRRTTKGRTTS